MGWGGDLVGIVGSTGVIQRRGCPHDFKARMWTSIKGLKRQDKGIIFQKNKGIIGL